MFKQKIMEENDFEGTLVLEKLAEMGLVEAFFEAVDADNVSQVKLLMRRAQIDDETIKVVLKLMREAD